MTWCVLRHGGRGSDKWLPLYEGENEGEARVLFDQQCRLMRQGGLALMQGGEVVDMKQKARPTVFGGKANTVIAAPTSKTRPRV